MTTIAWPTARIARIVEPSSRSLTLCADRNRGLTDRGDRDQQHQRERRCPARGRRSSRCDERAPRWRSARRPPGRRGSGDGGVMRHRRRCPVAASMTDSSVGLGARRCSATSRPSCMTSTRSAMPSTSGSSLETMSDGHAVGGQVGHQPVHLGLGADVDAAGRLVDDEHPRAGGQPLGQHDLLLVAAGQRADRVGRAGRP